MDKAEGYFQLASDVRSCGKCTNLSPRLNRDGAETPRALANVIAGRPDTAALGLGYWTDEAGNLDAQVFIIAQDPGDKATYFDLIGPSVGVPGSPRWCDPDSKPNDPGWALLMRCLSANGIALDRCYVTNAVLCARTTGRNTGPAEACWFENCSSFLARQIDLVRPRVIGTLGGEAFFATMSALGQEWKGSERMMDLIQLERVQASEETLVVPLYHPTARAKDRTADQQVYDYRRLASAILQ